MLFSPNFLRFIIKNTIIELPLNLLSCRRPTTSPNFHTLATSSFSASASQLLMESPEMVIEINDDAEIPPLNLAQWIGVGKKFPEGIVPPEVQSYVDSIMAIPDKHHNKLLPHAKLTVHEFIQLTLP